MPFERIAPTERIRPGEAPKGQVLQRRKRRPALSSPSKRERTTQNPRPTESERRLPEASLRLHLLPFEPRQRIDCGTAQRRFEQYVRVIDRRRGSRVESHFDRELDPTDLSPRIGDLLFMWEIQEREAAPSQSAPDTRIREIPIERQTDLNIFSLLLMVSPGHKEKESTGVSERLSAESSFRYFAEGLQLILAHFQKQIERIAAAARQERENRVLAEKRRAEESEAMLAEIKKVERLAEEIKLAA